MSGEIKPLLLRADAMRETADGWTLVGSRCRADGHISFPPRQTCPECLGDEIDPVDLSRSGTVFAHTTVHMRTAHFSPPYHVGYVDLDGNGPRVFAPLTGERVAIGARAQLAVGPMWEEDGAPVIAYQFEVSGESGNA